MRCARLLGRLGKTSSLARTEFAYPALVAVVAVVALVALVAVAAAEDAAQR
jgi:hypothetical protein